MHVMYACAVVDDDDDAHERDTRGRRGILNVSGGLYECGAFQHSASLVCQHSKDHGAGQGRAGRRICGDCEI